MNINLNQLPVAAQSYASKQQFNLLKPKIVKLLGRGASPMLIYHDLLCWLCGLGMDAYKYDVYPDQK